MSVGSLVVISFVCSMVERVSFKVAADALSFQPYEQPSSALRQGQSHTQPLLHPATLNAAGTPSWRQLCWCLVSAPWRVPWTG